MPEEKNKANKEDRGKSLASWTFSEFKKYKKSAGWYFFAVILTGALLVFAFITGNYLFAIFIILVIIIYIMRLRREPRTVQINIVEDGLELGEDTFYPWKEIKNFWIIYEPPDVKNLYFDFNVALRPDLSVSLEDQNPLRIRKILLDYLAEDTDKENESFSDGMTRMMKL